MNEQTNKPAYYTRHGWRYCAEFVMGRGSAVFTSSTLYPTADRASEAGALAYPRADYPDARLSVIEDHERTRVAD